MVGTSALVCILASPATPQTTDPHKLLAEADRLAWLRVWTRAEPLYGEAQKRFAAAGDRRNALYAEVCQLRGKLPMLSVPEVSERLAVYLQDSMVRADERLRLRVLVIKGETDEDLDPALSQRSWTEALALAEKLGEAGWANRARAELGLVAFLQGDTNTAIVNLGQAIKVAESTGDVSSLARWLTLFGHGYVELGRPEQALHFYDRALKIAAAVRELQLPVMTYLGNVVPMETQERFPQGLGNLAQNARFPHSHKPIISVGIERKERRTETHTGQPTRPPNRIRPRGPLVPATAAATDGTSRSFDAGPLRTRSVP
jgi:tetratricopeptide (TPR) repeat protein